MQTVAVACEALSTPFLKIALKYKKLKYILKERIEQKSFVAFHTFLIRDKTHSSPTTLSHMLVVQCCCCHWKMPIKSQQLWNKSSIK